MPLANMRACVEGQVESDGSIVVGILSNHVLESFALSGCCEAAMRESEKKCCTRFGMSRELRIIIIIVIITLVYSGSNRS